MSKALAVVAPGRFNWTRTDIQLNTGASYQDFVGDWAGSEDSDFDHSRKARGRGTGGYNPFQVGDKEVGRG